MRIRDLSIAVILGAVSAGYCATALSDFALEAGKMYTAETMPQKIGVKLPGMIFAGFFCAAMLKRRKRRYAFISGCILSIPWLIEFVNQYTSSYQYDPEACFISCVMLMLFLSFGAVVGASIYQFLVRSGPAWQRRHAWSYVTQNGETYQALPPYRNMKLARLWAGIGGLIIASSWVPFVSEQASRSNALYTCVQWICLGVACYFPARKLTTKSAIEAMVDDSRPPVLFLRSFVDDGSRSEDSLWRQIWHGLEVLIGLTYEQCLAGVAGKFGPFVAIGRPGEELPELGAARMYVDDDAWQDVVKDLIKKSKLIIVQVGSTMGIRWELGRISELVPPEQVVLFLPFVTKSKGKQKRRAYEHFIRWASEYLPDALPQTVGNSPFLYFEPGTAWKARELPQNFLFPKNYPQALLLSNLSGLASLYPSSGTLALSTKRGDSLASEPLETPRFTLSALVRTIVRSVGALIAGWLTLIVVLVALNLISFVGLELISYGLDNDVPPLIKFCCSLINLCCLVVATYSGAWVAAHFAPGAKKVHGIVICLLGLCSILSELFQMTVNTR
ncbi:MAG: hypothetical protein WCH39_10700 [Schlesneria sp.]